jgi:LPS-assembly protein
MITYGSRLPASDNATVTSGQRDKGIRGFIDANGRYQLGPNWTLTRSMRLPATAPSCALRHLERRSPALAWSRHSASTPTPICRSPAGSCRRCAPSDPQSSRRSHCPQIDYRRRITDPWLGGVSSSQANSLRSLRTEGQDTQRAFAGLRWDLRKLTPLGQEVTFTAYGRADIYHTDNLSSTRSPRFIAASMAGTTRHRRARGRHALAVHRRLPGRHAADRAARPAGGVAVKTRNLIIPNEDSRAIDLEDSNLFALNRFAGYDRWEDSSRITYGGEWNYQRPGWKCAR